MSYNNTQFQSYMNTAGKITIVTAFLGVVAFTLIFLLNIGAQEFKQAAAQSIATTSVTVLNTPPAFTAGPFETPPSSTSSPTNSGDAMTWTATGVDPSGQDYFLLICDAETASPTATNGAPPACNGADTQWGVSGTTTSGSPATVSTTTTEAFAESNVWMAWVCDAVLNARCNNIKQQGSGTSTSPFNVNHRPTFTGYWNDSPADPGTTVIFYATSTDSDTDAIQDTVFLTVCSTNSFNTTTDTCDATTLATTSFAVYPNATATYALATILQDDDYDAYAFITDVHGHEASGGQQGTGAAAMTVNNVAPTVAGGTIDLNGGVDMALTEGIETTGFTLDFVVTDNNSCDAVGGAGGNINYDEFSTSTISVFRSGISTSTCIGTSSAAYNANNCYTGANLQWNLQCTASGTTCSGITDSTMTVECTFPLWFIADPTDGATASDTIYFAEEWTAGVSATDDDSATSSFIQGTGSNPNVSAVLALNLLDATIPYGSIEPGSDTVTLSASTTVEATGNTGIDEELSGEDMCNTYTSGTPCSVSSTSTIPAAEQEYGTSELAYGAGTALSSSTAATLQVDILKSTGTTTPENAETWWGIAVPGAITFAGAYTGENTFSVILSDPSQW